MKTGIIAGATALLMLTSCAGNKSAADVQSETVETEPTTDIVGQWLIENIVLNDSVSVRPAEVTPDAVQYVEFTDSTYSFVTNCNTIFGTYTLSGDSITFNAGGMTRMMCDNSASEDAINKMLPNIAVVDMVNDSVARLNSTNASEYIVLLKNAGDAIQ